jgi:maltooligosyltrehalose trehalohydrolase
MPQVSELPMSNASPSLVSAGGPAEPPLLGARLTRTGVRFGAYATTAREVSVRVFDERGNRTGEHRLSAVGGGVAGFYEGEVAGLAPGALYKFVLDGRELPDPFARHLPLGVHGPAMVVEPKHVFRHGDGVSRPLREHVIYELHIGTFSPEGTFNGARERLGELAALGVTAIELLPVAAFAGTRGWGYDGVALFAPHAPYGTPDDLRALVDEAHGLGLAVFLDVVYNHFGPAGNYLSAYSPSYFTKAVRNAWGDAPDFSHQPMRRLVLENALEWLTSFRFDGLRLDAVHAIVDPSPRHVLAELASEVERMTPRKLLIAEDERNEPSDVLELGLDGIWADDFHHQVRVTLTGERDGYYAAYEPGVSGLARAISNGWLYEGQVYPPSGRPRGRPANELPAEAFVYCLQNHDQVGNRALGERLSHEVPIDAYRAVSTLLLFLPMTPLLFQGQEWAASTPFQFFTDHDEQLGPLISRGRREEFKRFAAFTDPARRALIPDPQAEETFSRSKLLWQERDLAHHARTLALYRALLSLRREDRVLRSGGRRQMAAAAHGEVLVVERWSADGVSGERRLLLVNFGSEPRAVAELLPEADEEPQLLLRSDEGSEGNDEGSGEGDGPGRLPPRTAFLFSLKARGRARR